MLLDAESQLWMQGSPLIDNLAGLLVAKLGDGQARIREAAMNSLITMARYVTVELGK